MKVYDLEKLGINKISFYLALEEYLLSKDDEAFFVWRIDKSIIIGKHQLLEAEVNVDYALSLGAEIFRRPSGGGAIFADEGCFMYTFITKLRNKDEIYKKYLSYIKDALLKLGLNVTLSGRNDLLFNDKKFSGLALYETKDGACLHGTFLFDTNLENLVKCVTPSNEKLISKGIKSVSSRVINLKNYLKISKKEVIKALEDEISPSKIVLGEDEIKKVRQLENKYLDKSWIFDKKPPYTITFKKRVTCGEFLFFIDIINDKIKNIKLFGDFFFVKDINNILSEFIDICYNLETINSIINAYNVSEYIIGIDNNTFIEILSGGLNG